MGLIHCPGLVVQEPSAPLHYAGSASGGPTGNELQCCPQSSDWQQSLGDKMAKLGHRVILTLAVSITVASLQDCCV